MLRCGPRQAPRRVGRDEAQECAPGHDGGSGWSSATGAVTGWSGTVTDALPLSDTFLYRNLNRLTYRPTLHSPHEPVASEAVRRNFASARRPMSVSCFGSLAVSFL